MNYRTQSSGEPQPGRRANLAQSFLLVLINALGVIGGALAYPGCHNRDGMSGKE